MNRFLIETLTDSSLPIHLGWALVHFLWQGSLVGIVAAVLLRLTPRDYANLRYRIS